MENREILTAKEVAAYLRMNLMTIYRLAQTGRIPAARISDCWRFRRKDIDQWLSEHRGNTRFLLVDGDRDYLESTGDMLTKLGTKISLVGTATEAIELIRTELFSHVLIGLNLPDCSGWECARELERSHPNLSVILLAGEREWGLLPKETEGYIVLDRFQRVEEWTRLLKLASV
jgi:excisionase family DNA binding protein